MSIPDKFSVTTMRAIGLIAVAMGLSLSIGVVGASQSERLYLGLQSIFFGILAISILLHPYLGIVATVASLPVVSILPPIPFATSTVAIIGGVTLWGFLMERAVLKKPFWKLSSIHFWALLLVVWLLLTNPGAALSDDDRNWFFTYAQLFLLLWLTGELLTTSQRHQMLMWVFAGLCVLSALFAITEGTIGPTWRTSTRAAGLAGGDNSAARYFLVGFVFFTFLSSRVAKQRWFQLAALVGSIILLVGVAYTLSRTGFILAVTAIGLVLIQRTAGRQRIGAVILFISFVAGAFALPDTYWQIMTSSMSDVQTGTGTMGLRYGLWQAGFQMWLDHPLTGVGIGQFDNYLPQYGIGLLPTHRLNLGAHNLYISMLAETGLVGFVLFSGLIANVLISLIRSTRSTDLEKSVLAQVWLIVLIVILVGGLTKHDQYDKLLWLVLGVGASLASDKFVQTEKSITSTDDAFAPAMSKEMVSNS